MNSSHMTGPCILIRERRRTYDADGRPDGVWGDHAGFVYDLSGIKGYLSRYWILDFGGRGIRDGRYENKETNEPTGPFSICRLLMSEWLNDLKRTPHGGLNRARLQTRGAHLYSRLYLTLSPSRAQKKHTHILPLCVFFFGITLSLWQPGPTPVGQRY